jgi:MFS family permease
MMGLVSLFTDFSSEMIFPLLPLLFTGLVGVRPAAVYLGVMAGLAEPTASLLKIFSGRISDRLGRRKALVVIGYGISTVARPLMALACAGWHVVALRVSDRIGKGIRTSPRDALISDAVGPEARGLAFGFHRAMDHLGAVLGPLVAVGFLYLLLGRGLWKGTTAAATPEEMTALRWLFGLALLPGLLAMLTLIGKVREIAPRPPGEAEAAGRKGWSGLPRQFYAYVGIVALFSLGNSSDLFLVFYGKTLFPQWGLLQMIGVWVLLHVAKVVYSVPGGLLSDHLGRRPVLIIGWGTYALVYLGMALVSAQWQFWALIAAYGFYYGMTEGAEKALVADFVPSDRRGTAYGIYHGAEGLAKLPASLMFGVFWYAVGATIAFGIGAALAGAAVVLLAILLSTTRQPPRQA